MVQIENHQFEFLSMQVIKHQREQRYKSNVPLLSLSSVPHFKDTKRYPHIGCSKLFQVPTYSLFSANLLLITSSKIFGISPTWDFIPKRLKFQQQNSLETQKKMNSVDFHIKCFLICRRLNTKIFHTYMECLHT